MKRRLEYVQHLEEREAKRLALEAAVEALLAQVIYCQDGISEVDSPLVDALRKAYEEVSE